MWCNWQVITYVTVPPVGGDVELHDFRLRLALSAPVA